MFNRRIGMLAMLSGLAFGVSPAITAAPAQQVIEVRGSVASRPERVRKAKPLGEPDRRRFRNKPQRRKLKPNRLHISRRVRRKHRRAAR